MFPADPVNPGIVDAKIGSVCGFSVRLLPANDTTIGLTIGARGLMSQLTTIWSYALATGIQQTKPTTAKIKQILRMVDARHNRGCGNTVEVADTLRDLREDLFRKIVLSASTAGSCTPPRKNYLQHLPNYQGVNSEQ